MLKRVDSRCQITRSWHSTRPSPPCSAAPSPEASAPLAPHKWGRTRTSYGRRPAPSSGGMSCLVESSMFFVNKNNHIQDLPTGGFRSLTGGFWAPVVTRKHLLEGPGLGSQAGRSVATVSVKPPKRIDSVRPPPRARNTRRPDPTGRRSRTGRCRTGTGRTFGAEQWKPHRTVETASVRKTSRI